MDTSDYLYHYTNIETLALILKNRTIRFNPLNKMDDLQEQETADIKNIGQFCYISSWTDEITESIPMWNMYASLDSGVRIGLKKNPFQKHSVTPIALSKALNMPLANNENNTSNIQPCPSLETYIPILDMIKCNFISGDILFAYYDMLIDDNLFSQMIVTASPKMSAGNKVIIDTLIKEYNPTAILIPSSLTNLI